MAWLAAACLALVVVGGGAGGQYYHASAVASVFSLVVYPSVELDVNRQEKVVSAVPLSADANENLDGMDLKGAAPPAAPPPPPAWSWISANRM